MISSAITPVHPPVSQPASTPVSSQESVRHRIDFDRALNSAKINLSNHAAKRLSRRGLVVNAGSAARIASGIEKAAARGSQTSLVLMDELALLVRVPERTVVTAMMQKAMRDGVVTRIDSAIVV